MTAEMFDQHAFAIRQERALRTGPVLFVYDRIVYDKESGKLRYDKDGEDGHKAKRFAILDDSPNDLAHHDFLIV